MGPDPTNFFSDFKDAKNIIFSYFFLLQPTRRHIIFSLIKFFANILYLNFILQTLYFILHALFQSAQHLYEKREGAGSVPLMDLDPDPVVPTLGVQIQFFLLNSDPN